MFVLIPLASVMFHLWFFLVIQTAIVTLRLAILYKIRSHMKCYDFIKELFNKVIWFCYNLCYLILAISQNSSMFLMKCCGLGIILFLFVGIALQTLFFILDSLVYATSFLINHFCPKAKKVYKID